MGEELVFVITRDDGGTGIEECEPSSLQSQGLLEVQDLESWVIEHPEVLGQSSVRSSGVRTTA